MKQYIWNLKEWTVALRSLCCELKKANKYRF